MVGTPSDICTDGPPVIMQGPSVEEWASEIGPAFAVVPRAERCPEPAEVLTARVSAVTEARAAARRGRIRRLDGCMQGPFVHGSRRSGCTLAITLGRGGRGRALEEPERGTSESCDSGHRKSLGRREITGDPLPV